MPSFFLPLKKIERYIARVTVLFKVPLLPKAKVGEPHIRVPAKMMKTQMLLFLRSCGIFLLVPELMFPRTRIGTPAVSLRNINYIRSQHCVSYKPGHGDAVGHLPPLRSILFSSLLSVITLSVW